MYNDINDIIAQVEMNEMGIEDSDGLFADNDFDEEYFPPANSIKNRSVSTSHFGGFRSEAWTEMRDYMREVYGDE